uniref:Uncharacterized protein n=1 Tax=Astyanax mexicanus TaxID=7994 RepID=A0A8B9HL71_ASTMX
FFCFNADSMNLRYIMLNCTVFTPAQSNHTKGESEPESSLIRLKSTDVWTVCQSDEDGWSRLIFARLSRWIWMSNLLDHNTDSHTELLQQFCDIFNTDTCVMTAARHQNKHKPEKRK